MQLLSGVWFIKRSLENPFIVMSSSGLVSPRYYFQKTRNSRGNKRSSGAGHSNTTGNPLGSSVDPEYYEQARRPFFYSHWLIFFRTGPTKCFGNCVSRLVAMLSRFVNGLEFQHSSTPVSKMNYLYSFTTVCRDALYNARCSIWD